jgi:predicted RNase H-like HicB family nuclease
MLKNFTLEYWMDDGWFVGKLKGIPGVFSQGETLGELEINIQDAYSLMIADEKDESSDNDVMTKEVALEIP